MPSQAAPWAAPVQTGIRLAIAQDYDGAMAALQEATAVAPNHPAGPLYIGYVERLRGDHERALPSFERALSLAGDRLPWQARALQGIAETLEHLQRLTDARDRWTDLLRLADAAPNLVDPAAPRARIQALDAVIERAAAYEPVRRRIADREADAAE